MKAARGAVGGGGRRPDRLQPAPDSILNIGFTVIKTN